ncbi:beta-ketoacyl synthase N-terminal-like domain-containing protein, partial [Lysobacter sp. 2RAB21]
MIDHLLEHHADALSHYFGLSANERSAEPVEVQAVALPTGNLGIAVVGMACKFADATTPEALWHNLIDQRSLIAPLTGNRWGGAATADAAPRWGALIEEVDRFDP